MGTLTEGVENMSITKLPRVRRHPARERFKAWSLPPRGPVRIIWA